MTLCRSGKLSISEVRVPSGSERQKEKLCWNGRDSVPDEGGDDSDHEEKSEQGLSVKSLDNHQDLPSIVKEQMDELKTMTEQIKLAQRGKASFKSFTTCCILSILWQPSDKLSHICHVALTANQMVGIRTSHFLDQFFTWCDPFPSASVSSRNHPLTG